MDDGSDLMKGLVRVLAALTLFGVSFAFVEASIVTYLRHVWEPLHSRLFPDAPGDSIFPIIRVDQWQAEGPSHMRLLWTELAREAATLVMLGSVAMASAQNMRQWFAGFMIAFGVWDIFFYVFLKVIVDWPESLVTWDLLFLLPVPWVGPVCSPVLVSLAMITAGVMILWRESMDRPVPLGWPQIMGIGVGGLVVIVAFCWDWRNIMAGGEPNTFHWPMFLGGLGIGLATFMHAFCAQQKPA
jgi:hypothetical protein